MSAAAATAGAVRAAAGGVRFTDARKSFGEHEVIHGVSLGIEPGEFCVFVGPSGCGKSTLLRMIAGLEAMSAGRVEIAGVDVTEVEPAGRGVAMVFQSYALYPHLTVFDNMAFSLQIARRPRAEIRAKVGEAARILRLTDHLAKRPSQLSGGQRQRVAIGRAIVREPKVFLFDEPLSNLDAELRVQMRLELARLHKEIGATMIYVTHDQVEAMTMADRIVVLDGGRVRQVGKPLDLYENPDDRFVAGFIGSPAMNFFAGTAEGADAAGALVRLDAVPERAVPVPLGDSRPASGDKVVVGIRPEHIEIVDAGGFVAHEELTEALGSVSFVHARFAGGEPVLVERRGEAPLGAGGKSFDLAFRRDKTLLFDAAGRRLR